MMSFIIGLGVVLILVILYQLFQVARLVKVAKGTSDDEVSPNNGIHATLFLVFTIGALGLFFWYSYAYYDDYTLPIASDHGVWVDFVFWITMAISVGAFVAISVLMFIFTYKYQYKENRRAKFYPDNHVLELTWTIIPAVVLAVLIFSGLRAWTDITGPAKPDAEVIELVAQQFGWTARYPGPDNELGSHNYRLIDPINEFGLDLNDTKTHDDFKSLELHIPKGHEVLLKIRAKDVLHSVFLPHFRVKMDAVPGMTTQFKFTPTKTTQEMRDELGDANFDYELACTEICGRGHFSMRMVVIVHEREDFETWKSDQEAWLKQNPDYLKQVAPGLREAAMIKAGIPVEEGSASSGNGQAAVGLF